jgi:hypothetical protein
MTTGASSFSICNRNNQPTNQPRDGAAAAAAAAGDYAAAAAVADAAAAAAADAAADAACDWVAAATFVCCVCCGATIILIQSVFRKLDVDSSGTIDKVEVETLLEVREE